MLPALVLTAGLGTRLDPVTRLVAKPAVPLGERTLVEHVLAWLTRQGTTHVVLNLHHRPATVSAIVADGTHLGLQVRYSWEQPVLGSAGGPRRALPLLDADSFLIVNGDTLCDFDLGALITAHHETRADVTLALVPNHAPDRYNGIRLDAEDIVTGFVPRGSGAEKNWHFVGVQIARRRVFERLPDGMPDETTGRLYREIVATTPGRIRGFRVQTSFIDVGTPRDYLRAALERMAEAHGGPSTVTRSLVWAEAAIASGAHLDECIVAGRVRVPHGVRAQQAVLVPADLVRPADRATVVGDVAIFPFTP